MKTKLAVGLTLFALVITACGGGRTAPTVDGGDGGDAVAIAEGESLYNATCSTCHADDGTGIDGLGKALVGSEFIAGLDDASLVDFIIEGRPASDPDNSFGFPMPPKGGNQALTTEQIGYIVTYIRTIN